MQRYANLIGWSDITPYEVIRTISEKCLEVRQMAYILSPDWKPEVVAGGFAGHCVNQADQQWIIMPNESAPVLRIRLRKNGQWHSAYGRHALSDTAIRHYDYNF
jgi:hypothetical protein